VGTFEDREKKIELVREFEEQVRHELKDFAPPCRTPKVFTIPMDDDTSGGELLVFSVMINMLPEEYYMYVLIKVLFTEVLEQASTDETAELLFLPMHVPVYSVMEVDLGASLRESGVLDSPKPKLCVFSWDTYPRPPFRRANPFSPIGRQLEEQGVFLRGCRDWMDDSWYLAVTESTIDRHPNDFGLAMFPRPHHSRLDKGFDKPWLYSFCGVLNYEFDDEMMPIPHIRGDRFEKTWNALATAGRDDVFVGELAHAQAAFGPEVSYRDFTSNSIFTLCPAGWARWSFRLYEAIQDGSIPVILSDYHLLPFDRHVPWSDLSLRLPEAGLHNIDEILRSLPAVRVAHLQRSLDSWRDEFSIKGLASNICREVSHRLFPAV